MLQGKKTKRKTKVFFWKRLFYPKTCISN